MAARDSWASMDDGAGYTDSFTVSAGATEDLLIYGGLAVTITGIPGSGGKWNVKMACSADPDTPGADDFMDSGHGDMPTKRMIHSTHSMGLTVLRIGAIDEDLTVRATMT